MGPTAHEHDCYWYAARNVPRGAGYVEAAVANCLAASSGTGTIVTEADVLKALGAAKPRADISKAIREQLQGIWNALRPTWTEGYGRHFKKQSAWENIPVFVCGGGARLRGVKEVFAKAWVPTFKDFSISGLPVPEEYDSINGTIPFDRMSVAYGLTYLSPELGDFVLPADSPNHTPLLRYRELPMPWADGEPG